MVTANKILRRLKQKDEKLANYIDEKDINTIIDELSIYEAELLAQNDELIKVQSELRTAQLEYKTIFNSSPIALSLIDRKANIIKTNEEFKSTFDLENSPLKKRPLFNYIDKEQIGDFFKWIEHSLFEDRPIIISFKCKEQQVKKFKVKADNFPNNKSWLLVSFSDIDNEVNLLDKNKKLELERLEQQKLILTQSKIAAVGEMLSNIAHQWRQPLSIISMRAGLLQAKFDLDGKITYDDLISSTNSITNQTDYLSKTIEDFRNFFTEDSQQKIRFNLKDSFNDLYNLVIDSLENNFITCVHNFNDDIYIVNNSNQLIQAMINICNNAKDSIKENIPNTEERYFFVDLNKNHKNAIITFKDSGGGIDLEIIDKIFEPYFTTKHQSVGTGIGLYMTNEIITKHFNGTLEVENVDYTYDNKALSGALFTIKIPLDSNN